MRSRIPPWPSMTAPKSLTPASRLIALITRPPRKPISVIAKDIPAACQPVNGVAHESNAPRNVAHLIHEHEVQQEDGVAAHEVWNLQNQQCRSVAQTIRTDHQAKLNFRR